MHFRKSFLVSTFVLLSLIPAQHAIRVDTPSSDGEKSESVITGESSADQPKAEALTLLVQKRVPLRPVKVIERSDDVVVIHAKSRAKRKQNSRGRRRPSNQFRSKIRPSKGSSNFGGFKDFSSNDLRFPPFPTKPPRASNKLKFGSTKSKPSYDFNSQQRRPRPSQVVQTISAVYGPPSTSYNNQIESHFNQPVTLQQAQSNLPSFSVHAVEPIQTTFFTSPSGSGGSGGGGGNGHNNFRHPDNNFGNSNNNYNNFGPTGNSNNNNINHNNFGSSNNNNNNNFQSHNDINRFSSPPQSISNFPLGDGSSFNVPKTSYGEPVRSASSPSTSSYQFNSIIGNQQAASNNRPQNHNNNNNNNNNYNANANSNNGNNFPKLPNRYESGDFQTPTRHNPLNSNNFDFGNLDVLSETKNVLSSALPGRFNEQQKNRFNKFNNFDYDFGKNYEDEDDDEDEDLEFLYTTRRPRFPPPTTTTTTTTPFPTTTKRSKKGVFGKRRRPTKIPQNLNHNLDTDDLRDAFTESSNDDFHEVSLNSDDFLNFDSQRNIKKSSTNPLHEIHSTLKAARNNPALRHALGDDFQIVSIEKSLEKNGGANNDFGGFNFQRRGDNEPGNKRNDQQQFREFSVGGEIAFSEVAPPNVWNGDMNSFPRNHRYS